MLCHCNQFVFFLGPQGYLYLGKLGLSTKVEYLSSPTKIDYLRIGDTQQHCKILPNILDFVISYICFHLQSHFLP